MVVVVVIVGRKQLQQKREIIAIETLIVVQRICNRKHCYMFLSLLVIYIPRCPKQATNNSIDSGRAINLPPHPTSIHINSRQPPSIVCGPHSAK